MIDKTSLVVWITTLTIGVCALMLVTGPTHPEHYMAVTALISFAIAVFGLREIISLDQQGASISAVSAATARYMGLVYA